VTSRRSWPAGDAALSTGCALQVVARRVELAASPDQHANEIEAQPVCVEVRTAAYGARLAERLGEGVPVAVRGGARLSPGE